MSINSISRKKTQTIMLVVIFAGIMTGSMFISSARANPITITVSPTSGSAETIISVSGEDATANGEVRVYLASFLVSFFMATTTANSTGGYSVNVTLPTFPSGSYSILARDITTDDTVVAPFTIQAKIVANPTEGSCNDKVTVKGYGFNSDTPIELTFNGTDVTPVPQPRTTPFGSFKAEISVPKVPKGTYQINAADGTYYALAPYAVIPKITLTPTSGPSATPVFINGTGFAPSAAVSIEFSHLNVTMYPPFPTDMDGSFMQLFLVPEVFDGTYIVNATDETGNSANVQFLVPSPVLTVQPGTVTGNSMATAKGSGFPPNQPVLLYLEDNMMVNLLELMTGSEALFADEYGAYEYSFIIPVEKPGIYKVVAYSLAGFGFEKGEELASTSITIVDNAILLEMENQIATIIIPNLGIIRENLTAINAELIKIEGNTATINSTLGLIQANITDLQLTVTAIDVNTAIIQTTLGTIQGRITSIEGNTATIETDIGTLKTQISNVQGNQETFTIPLYIGLALALIAAIGAIYLVIIHVQTMRRARSG